MKNSFSKKERIHKKEEIDQFFKSGKHFVIHPFRVIHYTPSKEKSNHSKNLKIIISIPKKLIKKAVDRNLLKRRTREAYRLNKNSLLPNLTDSKKNISILLIYTSPEHLKFSLIESKIILILQRLRTIYAGNTK